MSDIPEARLSAFVHGRVQGVGFRWGTRSRARELGLAGFARNLYDGRVEVVAEGPRAKCEQLLAWLRSNDTPGKVDTVVEDWAEPTGRFNGFGEC